MTDEPARRGKARSAGRPRAMPRGLARLDDRERRDRTLHAPRRDAPDWADSVDLEALLVALVLVPQSYSRNRFFGLYRWPPARRVRRRAALLRSIVSDLVRGPGERRACDLRQTAQADGYVVLEYRLPALGVRRAVRLSTDEVGLVKLAVARARASGAPYQGLATAAVAAHSAPADVGRPRARRRAVDDWHLEAGEMSELQRRASRVLARLLPEPHAPGRCTPSSHPLGNDDHAR